jgi:hypothetical protein
MPTVIQVGRCQLRFGFVGKNYGSWIYIGSRRNEDHALTPLRDERKAIYYTIGPSIAALLERFDESSHAAPFVELQHE